MRANTTGGETQGEPRCPDSITFERMYVGRDNEWWSLGADCGWPFSVPNVEGAPREFEGILGVLRHDTHRSYESEHLQARRTVEGIRLSAVSPEGEVFRGVVLSQETAFLLVGMIERCLGERREAVRARHEKTLAAFAELARVFEQALLTQAYGDWRAAAIKGGEARR